MKQPEYKHQLTFTNREEYQQYRTEWKDMYAALSQNIRNAKFCAWYNRLGPKRQTKELNHRFDALKHWHGATYYSILVDIHQASAMLLELKAAKVEAQRQYLAEKEAAVLA
jgi:hypothetical protein